MMNSSEKLTNYHNPEPFESFTENPSSDPHNTLSNWTQTKEFQTPVKELVQEVLKDQDEIAKFSKRLLENGAFLRNYKKLVSEEIDANRKSSLWNLLRGVLVALIAGLIGFFAKVLLGLFV